MLLYLQTESIFDLSLKWPWYLWNKNNNKIYNIFLKGCISPQRMRMSDILSIDYSLAIKVNKIFYVCMYVYIKTIKFNKQ